VWYKIFKKHERLASQAILAIYRQPAFFIHKQAQFHLSKLQISPGLVLCSDTGFVNIHSWTYCAWALKKCFKLSTVKTTRYDTIFLFFWHLWGHCKIFAALFGTRSF